MEQIEQIENLLDMVWAIANYEPIELKKRIELVQRLQATCHNEELDCMKWLREHGK